MTISSVRLTGLSAGLPLGAEVRSPQGSVDSVAGLSNLPLMSPSQGSRQTDKELKLKKRGWFIT